MNDIQKNDATGKLISVYHELSMKPTPYYKSYIQVTLRRGGSFRETVVHSDPNHIKLQPKGHYKAKHVRLVTLKDASGREVPLMHIEYLTGMLYAPPNRSGFRKLGADTVDNYESCLNFVCDVDIARRNGLTMQQAVAPYLPETHTPPTRIYQITKFRELRDLRKGVQEGTVSPRDRRIPRLSKELTAATGMEYHFVFEPAGGTPTLKVSEEMLGQPHLSPADINWIKRNAKILDSDNSFHHEDYRDFVMANSVELIEDLDSVTEELDT